MADNFKVNTGTAITVAADDISSVFHPRVKISVGADGAAADWAGTIGTVSFVDNINTGTITKVEGGTIVNDNISFRHPDEFATVISTGTSLFATIKPLVSGSQIFITDLIVSATTATDLEIASGGTSTPIIGTLHFGADGGMAAPNFKVYPRTVAGSALTYKQSANIGLTITCHGYVD